MISWKWLGTRLKGATVTTTSHKVNGLDLNNTYFFEVQWVKAGDVSETVTGNVTQVGSIALSWDNPHDGTITRYQYQLKENDGTPDA